MTPMQRVLTALGQEEPDKVPLILLTMHGAKAAGRWGRYPLPLDWVG